MPIFVGVFRRRSREEVKHRKSDEVKGEGYILNLILYSFFRVFPIFDPRVPFRFSLAARIYKKEFSNLHPSPFYLTFYVSNSYG